MNRRTAQAIIDMAYARSKRADPNAEDTTLEELVVILDEIIGTYFQEGARINPDYMGKREVVEWDEAREGWVRPPGAEMILRIEDAAGKEVPTVTFDDKKAEASAGVYPYGGIYYRSLDDSGLPAGRLVFFCARTASPIEDGESEIDRLWPHGHEHLPALELAMYLAVKDGREDDLMLLAKSRNRQAIRFGKFLEHEDTTVRRRKRKSRVFATGSIKPVVSPK